MFNTITAAEVIAEASNAAQLANCPIPSKYRNTEWEDFYRAHKENFQRDWGIY